MLDESRLQAVQYAAESAMELAGRLHIPPTPPIFEVLVAHVSGNDQNFCAEVRKALSSPAQEREERLTRIHDDHLGSTALEQALERVRGDLSAEISQVSDKLSSGMRGSVHLAAEIRKGLREMAGTVTREDLQTACKHIVFSSRKHLDETQSVSARLERTQFELAEMQKELTALREAASKDHLTGLPNRRYLEDRLDMILSSGDTFCFAIIDLDHFKGVNDKWGHAAGDNILRGIGRILHDNTKGGDFAARIGGEEFALVLPDTPLSGARALCETIRSKFAEILWVSQQSGEPIGSLTLSAGVTERNTRDSALTLFERADGLLYEAKAKGRDSVVAGP